VTVVHFCITRQFIGVSLSYAIPSHAVRHFTSFSGTQQFKCNFTRLLKVTYRPFFNQQVSFFYLTKSIDCPRHLYSNLFWHMLFLPYCPPTILQLWPILRKCVKPLFHPYCFYVPNMFLKHLHLKSSLKMTGAIYIYTHTHTHTLVHIHIYTLSLYTFMASTRITLSPSFLHILYILISCF
jgi:hypothetical protein